MKSMGSRSCSFITLGSVGSGLAVVLGVWIWLHATGTEATAGPPWLWGGRHTGWGFLGREEKCGPQALSGTWYRFPPCAPGGGGCGLSPDDVGGTWMWMRSPEQERVVVSSLFNRYCIRCHGVDGRGVWDMPGVPDFTNLRWQASRSDAQIARIIIEGRGAVMPPFRGTLALEEAWAMARYLRTFVPGTETPRPDLGPAEKAGAGKSAEPAAELPPPRKEK